MKNIEEREAALRGMRRASLVARERAARHGLQVPVWRDGSIHYLDARKENPLHQTAERFKDTTTR